MGLHINLDNLLGCKVIESNRIEFKKGWNPGAIIPIPSLRRLS